jgi:hypothetical protein
VLPFGRSLGNPVILLGNLQQAIARVSHPELLRLVSRFRGPLSPMLGIKDIYHGSHLRPRFALFEGQRFGSAKAAYKS